ncbi:hypothetical protein TrVE_jg107 [Triparma verrucosa]|uniref:AFG1-like ATPase n=1 Tax=Triparma verrucosa TaxID=1606542 RepID=A0A9W7KT04_9STRA|nr:hypothetical protein TrVE_jg107 [Triparma verrucosa]
MHTAFMRQSLRSVHRTASVISMLRRNLSSPTVLQSYTKIIEEGNTGADEHQLKAVAALDTLLTNIVSTPNASSVFAGVDQASPSSVQSSQASPAQSAASSLFSLFSSSSSSSSSITSVFNSSPSSLPGVYIHGGVGCGKTFCMNLFQATLSSVLGPDTVQKKHFHEFMLSVHQKMHDFKKKNPGAGDPLPHVINSLMKDGKIICFDEFQVTDVADALILRRLFTGLYDQGCVFVFTSNRKPDDLYLGGLQRDLFVPFIDVLKTRNEIVDMWESDVDYRLVFGQYMAEGVYFLNGEGGDERFEKVWEGVVGGGKVDSMTLRTQGRDVFVPESVEEKGIARFNFWDLCGKSKGAADFLTIGQSFKTIFLFDVPVLEMKDVNVVRRFITLIDALYECECKIVVLAETRPEGIFKVDLEDANCDEAFAFDRTRSRLDEMMSEEWLKRTEGG